MLRRAGAVLESRRSVLGLQIVLVVSGVWFRWPTMSYALTEAHAFRQTQTTTMIREYMTTGLWQISPLPLFGPPWQLPMEFPLFQWLSALGGLLVGASPQIAGRLGALVCFEICALLAAYLAYRWFSPLASIVVVGMFQFLPFGIQWGNAPLIEFLATAGALFAVVTATRYIDITSRRWIWLATAGMIVAFLVKPTTAIVWLPAYVAISVRWTADGPWRANRSRLVLGIPVAGGLIAALAWTRFADAVKGDSAYTAFLTSSNLSQWNYGTVDQRLDSATWQYIVSYGEAIYGSLWVWIALLVVALYVGWNRALLLGLAVAMPAGAMVFTNLYMMHNYYQSAVFPALALVMAAGVAIRVADG